MELSKHLLKLDGAVLKTDSQLVKQQPRCYIYHLCKGDTGKSIAYAVFHESKAPYFAITR